MEKFFVAAGIFILSIVSVVSTGHMGSFPARNITVNPTSGIHGDNIQAKGEISMYGQTITLDLAFPKAGGAVEGSVGGTCTGPITGTYSGGVSENIVAHSSALCHAFFKTIQGEADFSGTVNLSTNTINGTYSVKAKDMTKSGDLVLNIVQ